MLDLTEFQLKIQIKSTFSNKFIIICLIIEPCIKSILNWPLSSLLMIH